MDMKLCTHPKAQIQVFIDDYGKKLKICAQCGRAVVDREDIDVPPA